MMGEANSASEIGYLQLLMGNYVGSQEWLDRGMRALRSAEAPARESFLGLLHLASLALATGRDAQALAYAEQGSQLAQQLDGLSSQAKALVILGHAYANAGRPGDAARAYERALAFYTELGHAARAVEPRAGLARVALLQGDRQGALGHAEVALATLASQRPENVPDPFPVYLACYRVLRANRDERAAAALEAARQRLWEYADQIADKGLRRSFLENVAANRELLSASPETLTFEIAPRQGQTLVVRPRRGRAP
jgi:tetratricopeptide (TPR) repeat protein